MSAITHSQQSVFSSCLTPMPVPGYYCPAAANLARLAEVALAGANLKSVPTTTATTPVSATPSKRRVTSVVDMHSLTKKARLVISMDGKVALSDTPEGSPLPPCTQGRSPLLKIKNGPTIVKRPDGTVLQYDIQNGKPHGPARVTKSDGTKIEFWYNKGKIEPPAIKIQPDGQISVSWPEGLCRKPSV